MNRTGIALAMASFLMWGTFPLYWANTIAVPAFEVLSHRGFWIVPFLLVVITWARMWPGVREAFSRTNLPWLMVSAVLISINWGVYVWAVAEQAVTEAALGYYLTPLLNVAAGMLLFGEQLSRLKVLALGIAGIGVLSVALLVGSWPWFGLAVGFSFAAYSSARKKAKVEAIQGLTAESFLLFPIWAIYLWVWGDMKWVTTEPTAIWLVLGGAVT
ncbi:MAG: EamA family transporter RarD, partial [Pseudomonadales bacterium]